MLRVNRTKRQVLARARAKIAGASDAAAAELVTEAAPEPQRREHLYGSTYRVRMSFEELMKTRGYLGEQVLAQRRRIVPSTDGERQRNAAARRAGYRPGEVLWPSD